MILVVLIIHKAEASGVPLRNIEFSAVIDGETDRHNPFCGYSEGMALNWSIVEDK